jgi:hypothetical protein
MLRNAVACLCLLGVAGAASAQQATEQQRLDSIWYAATNRISQQSDVWYKHGEFLPCIQLLKIETTIFPYDFDSVSTLGWLQGSTNDEAGELATYVNFRRSNPDDPDGPYLEAEYYYKKKLYAKVPPLLEPLLKMPQHPHPNIYRELAHCYEDMNLLADSKRVWEALLVVVPTDDAAKQNLQRVEKKLKGEVPIATPDRKKSKA